MSQTITVVENSGGPGDGWNGAQINPTMAVFYNMLQAGVTDMNDKVWHKCCSVLHKITSMSNFWWHGWNGAQKPLGEHKSEPNEIGQLVLSLTTAFCICCLAHWVRWQFLDHPCLLDWVALYQAMNKTQFATICIFILFASSYCLHLHIVCSANAFFISICFLTWYQTNWAAAFFCHWSKATYGLHMSCLQTELAPWKTWANAGASTSSSEAP